MSQSGSQISLGQSAITISRLLVQNETALHAWEQIFSQPSVSIDDAAKSFDYYLLKDLAAKD